MATEVEQSGQASEQASRADLLRARNAEKREQKKKQQAKKNTTSKSAEKPFPISPVESGIGMMIGISVDAFELLGAIVAPITAAANIIPVVGQIVSALGLVIAGASAVIGAVFSGIMFLGVGLWFLWKGVYPNNPRNVTLYIALFSTTFGNALFTWLPAWFGFFFWLFYRFYKQKLIPSPASKK